MSRAAFLPGFHPPVSANDRLGVTLFLAIILHALIILGSSFTADQHPVPKKSLEITLAQYKSDKIPNKADFLAQNNQQGSGTAETKRLPSTTEASLFQNQSIQPQSAPPMPTTSTQDTTSAADALPDNSPDTSNSRDNNTHTQPVVTSNTPRPDKAYTHNQPSAGSISSLGQASAFVVRATEIANLQAQIRLKNEALAKMPRVRRLTSASTMQYNDALYLNSWRERIEYIGNLNYPEEAQRQGIYGTLILLTVIRSDGSLEQVKVLRSSGRKVLDDAAIRIVQLAAPFQPFNAEMKKTTDVLEIIRILAFEKTAQVY